MKSLTLLPLLLVGALVVHGSPTIGQEDTRTLANLLGKVAELKREQYGKKSKETSENLEQNDLRQPETHADIRLVDGDTETEGRIEVFHDGVWKTVCDNYWWGVDLATIVCRELGLPTNNVLMAQFGSSNGPIYTDDYLCKGTESSLRQCEWFPGQKDDCDHSDDIGVMCYEECSFWQFRCANNKCIPYVWRCDNANDCGDNSDELDCTI